MRARSIDSVTAADAVALLAAAAALHDAPDLRALLDPLPGLVHDLVEHDALEVLGTAVPASGRRAALLDQRLAVGTPGGGDAVTGLLLTRRSRPFDRRDVTVAGLLGPMVGAAVDHVRLRVLHTGVTSGLRGLTLREREVLALVAGGRTTRDIARDLFIEARTVEKHVEHIRAKLGARSRAEAAAAWARAAALV